MRNIPAVHDAVQLPARPRLVLTTLGAASVDVYSAEGRRSEAFSSGKPLGLVTYLAFCPDRTVTRDHLIDLLWADLEPVAAHHALRQTVWLVHQRLGARALVAQDHGLTLRGPVASDRDAFLHAVERGKFERAVELYCGEFLPGFAVSGGADFEQWADLERHRLRLTFRRAAELALKDRLSRGRLREARQLALRVRDIDSGDQGNWRLLLATLVATHDRAQAELEAQVLERLLADQGRALEPVTAELVATLRQAAPAREALAASPSLGAAFSGRDAHCAAILAAWEVARRGGGHHLHVTGAAGLGKTRLLAELHARLQARGARTVVVRADQGDRAVSHTLVSDVALALAQLPGAAAVSPAAAGALVALNPRLGVQYVVRPTGAGPDDALAELLRAVADEQPVALLIDDLHRADPVSRRTLLEMLARLSGRRVLAVTTALPEAGAPAPATAADVLVLDPLSVRDTRELLTSLGSLPDDPWAEQLPAELRAASHGSPLLMLQRLRCALDEGWLRLEGGRWEWVWGRSFRAGFGRTQPSRQRAMTARLREFLESYQLYRRFRLHEAAWWNGEWPELLHMPCPDCGETHPHRVWPCKIAGLTPEWGVYMIHATCERCAADGLMFWVEVNQREGWMQKAGQLPARPAHSVATRSA